MTDRKKEIEYLRYWKKNNYDWYRKRLRNWAERYTNAVKYYKKEKTLFVWDYMIYNPRKKFFASYGFYPSKFVLYYDRNGKYL